MKTLITVLAFLAFIILFYLYLVKTAVGDPKDYPIQNLPNVPKKYDNLLIFLMIMGAIGCLITIIYIQNK